MMAYIFFYVQWKEKICDVYIEKETPVFPFHENKWGSVICQVSKIEPERKIDTFYYLYTKNNLLYTALPAVITTQYILEGKTKIGLNCLCDSLNCQSFMSDLDFYGIKYSYYEHKN